MAQPRRSITYEGKVGTKKKRRMVTGEGLRRSNRALQRAPVSPGRAPGPPRMTRPVWLGVPPTPTPAHLKSLAKIIVAKLFPYEYNFKFLIPETTSKGPNP